MLHDFLVTHKAELVRRCTLQAVKRIAPQKIDVNMGCGIPLFLDQLTKTLLVEQEGASSAEKEKSISSKIKKPFDSELRAAAAQHGKESSQHDVSIDYLVREYGDLCQAITKLAIELDVSIDVSDFMIFNRCLDDAIANAVTEYCYQKDTLAASRGARAIDERLRVLANEQRHHLRTAELSMKAIRAGNVGLNGATGAILELSLASLQKLQDRFLNGLGWSAELPARQQVITIANFIAEVSEANRTEAQTHKHKVTVRDVDKDLAVVADGDLLFMAVGTLLRNASKNVLQNSEIILSGRASGERVLIEIASVGLDRPREKMELPMPLDLTDESGELQDDLDLSMCRRGIEASNGFLRFRGVPGEGEIFTIDLPRYLSS